MRVLAVFALLLLGCAVEVEGDSITSEVEPSSDAPALDARVPVAKGGTNCAPLLNASFELQGWLCAAPRLIDLGDEFGDPLEGPLPPSDPLTSPDPTGVDR